MLSIQTLRPALWPSLFGVAFGALAFGAQLILEHGELQAMEASTWELKAPVQPAPRLAAQADLTGMPLIPAPAASSLLDGRVAAPSSAAVRLVGISRIPGRRSAALLVVGSAQPAWAPEGSDLGGVHVDAVISDRVRITVSGVSREIRLHEQSAQPALSASSPVSTQAPQGSYRNEPADAPVPVN